MLSDLILYKNKQIIINEYDDEELIKRNGFMFEEITIQNNKLLFYKNSHLIYQIDLPVASVLRKDGSFPNFYVVESGPLRTEIYFP